MPNVTRPIATDPRITAVKATVRALLQLDEQTAVMVRELACTEPGCPPIETVVAVLPEAGESQRWTLHQPVEAITEADLRAVLLYSPTNGVNT